MKKMFFAFVLIFVFVSIPSFAQIDLRTSQQSVSDFANEVGSTIWFNPGEVAEGYGFLGFSASVSLTSANVNGDAWDSFVGTNAGSSIYITTITLRKGITKRLSVGFRFSDYSDINANSWGAEVKYVFVKGSAVVPAISGRITYTKLTNAGILDANALSVGVMISKGFLNFTPYCGAALVRSDIDVNADTWGFSKTETSAQVYAGVRITLIPMISITGEVSSGEITKYTVKAGIRF